MEILSKKSIACNSRFELFFAHIRDGKEEVPNYLIVEPLQRTSQGISGVAILPVLAHSKHIALIEIYRPVIAGYSWEVPRGFVDDDSEDEVLACLRELKEETGLVCSPESLQDAGKIWPDTGLVNGCIKLFIAHHCHQDGAPEEMDPGQRRLAFFSFEEIRSMIDSDLIRDPSTLVSYYKYALEKQAI